MFRQRGGGVNSRSQRSLEPRLCVRAVINIVHVSTTLVCARVARHVHQMRGALALGRGPLKRTTFINAANALRDKSLGLRDPIVFDLEVPKA